MEIGIGSSAQRITPSSRFVSLQSGLGRARPPTPVRSRNLHLAAQEVMLCVDVLGGCCKWLSVEQHRSSV